MKRFVLAFSALVLSVGLFAQEPNTQGTVKKAENYVKFTELRHDFGKIKVGVPVTYDFIFSNIADKPVVIETATPSCGCTTPVWPQAPIAKGKEDKITAGFNAGSVGPFNKTITVKLAGVDQTLTLVITGDVLSDVDYAKYEKEKGTRKG